MSVQAIERGGYQPAEVVGDSPGWFSRNRGPIIRHAVINFFMVIILAPLAWVLIMSVKSRPELDARRLLAAQIRFHPLWLRVRQDRHAPDQPVQQHLRHHRDGPADHRLRRARRLRPGAHEGARHGDHHRGPPGLPLPADPRRLDHLDLRDPELPQPDQRDERPHPPVCHAQPRDQHPHHAVDVPAHPAPDDRGRENGRRRPLADPVRRSACRWSGTASS